MTHRVQPTRILIVGGGGREHALAWKLAAEPGVNEVLVAPGSDGIAREPRVRVAAGVDPLDPAAIVAVARGFAAELVVVGPEAPLAAGVADALNAAGVPVFGPSAAAARIESSKAFCREIATAAGVPMADGRAFPAGPAATAAARDFAASLAARGGIVVKADGLAAGKGVTVCDTLVDAEAAIDAIDGPLVVEERLVGPEASVIAICDGRRAIALPISRDHKRLADGDSGPNTGGMGACSPLDDLPDDAAEEILERFHRPVLAELARRGTPFRGALYAGLLLADAGPRLLEFNARFGDPETQVIMARMRSDIVPILQGVAEGQLKETKIDWAKEAAVCVVVTARGYPDAPETGDPISGLEDLQGLSDVMVFHAATARRDDKIVTVGGRVLGVTALGANLDAAVQRAYGAVKKVSFEGMHYRKDIGQKALARLHAPR